MQRICQIRLFPLGLVAGLTLLFSIPAAIAQKQLLPAALGGDKATVSAGEAADAKLPAPRDLAADWWNYFDVDDTRLAERRRRYSKHLASIQESLANQDDVSLGPVFDEVEQLLERYVSLRKVQAMPLDAPAPLTEKYDVKGYLDLVTLSRDAVIGHELESADLARQEKAIKLATSSYNDAMASYLAEGIDRAEHLANGLKLVRDRFQIAVGEQQIRLQKPVIEAKLLDAKRLAAALTDAGRRLTADVADVARYESDATQAAEALKLARSEADFARLRSQSKLGSGVQDRDNLRLQTQSLLVYEARVADAELKSAQSTLALRLVVFLTREDPPANVVSALRESVADVRKILASLRDQLERWRDVSERERQAAESRLAITEGGNAAIADLQRARISKADTVLRDAARIRGKLHLAAALVDVSDNLLAKQQGTMLSWWHSVRGVATDIWGIGLQISTASLLTVNDTPLTLLGVFRFVLILLLALWFSKVVRRFLDRTSGRRPTMNRASLYTLGRLFHYSILALGILFGLSSVGIDVTKFALLLSAVGIGLGFGLQAIFSNFVAGLIILFEKSLKVGDFVDLESGVHGEVREINIRSTLVTTNDNVDILVPNSEFVNGRVTNWTLRDSNLRLRVPFGVAYGTDKELLKKAGLEAAGDVEYTILTRGRRSPQVWLVGFGDSRMECELVVWLTPDAVRRPNVVQAAYCWALESALVKHGIEIALPQRVLHFADSKVRRPYVDTPDSAQAPDKDEA